MIPAYRKQLNKTLAEYNHVKGTVKEEKEALAIAQEKVELTTQAQQIVQAVAEGIQNKVHNQIASVVSRCLESVFEDPYEFKIKFEQKRGKTEAQLVFVRDGQELDPTEAAGGGVVDITALALRLVCLVLSNPKRRKLLILDEPLRFLSIEYREAAKEMILALAKEMGVQFIVVTHSNELIAGKVVEL